jgi:hypothetical protein
VQPASPATSTDAAMSDPDAVRMRRRFPARGFPGCCFPDWPFWDCWFSDWRIPDWCRGVSARITLPFCHAAPQGNGAALAASAGHVQAAAPVSSPVSESSCRTSPFSSS